MPQPEISPDTYSLSGEESIRIFEEDIFTREFSQIHGIGQPLVVYIGGQPGAGKSSLQTRVASKLELRDGISSVMEINNDKFRKYHPEYSRLQREDDQRASYFTNIDADKWVQMAVATSQRIRPHVLLESSLRKPHESINITQSYKNLGFGAELHLVVVHEFTSRLSIAKRYLGQVVLDEPGRYVIRSTHDESYNEQSGSLATMAGSGVFDYIALHRRNSDIFADYRSDQDTDPADLVIALEQERRHELAQLDQNQLLKDLEWCISTATDHNRQECLNDLLDLQTRLEHLA